jgi:hypothetical protein
MSVYCEIGIPVPRYLKKYLNKRYGTDHKVSRHSAIGLLIIELSAKKHITNAKIRVNRKEEFVLNVGRSYFKNKVYNIRPKNLKLISNLLYKLFIEDLVNTTLSNASIFGITEKQALINFLDYYEINEDDIKFETIYMSYRRKKKKKNSTHKKVEKQI